VPIAIARSLHPRALLVLVAAVALVVGAGLGWWWERDSEGSSPTRAGAGAPGLLVAAGAIAQQPSVRAGWEFVLPVYNASAAPVDVALQQLTGLTSPFRSEGRVHVPSGSWRQLPFSVPVSCDTPTPGTVPSVRLRVTGDHRTGVVSAPLQGAGQVLVDYVLAVCGAGHPVGPRDLADATWLVERAYGPQRYVAGTQVMRFGRDGSLLLLPAGRFLEGSGVVRGDYRVRGEDMVITTRNGAGCGAGARATWRATIDAGERLRMVYLGGDCPEGQQGNVWVARRLTPG
jgi:hypothetical protein